MRFALLFAACAVLSTSVARAEGDDPLGIQSMPNKHYLVTTKHSPDQCLAVLDEMAAKTKYTLGKMRWGCMAGDHTGYMFVDAIDEQDALKFLSPMARATAKVEEVQKITPRRLKALHASLSKPAASGTGTGSANAK